MRLIDADKIKLPQDFFEKVDNVPKFYEWLDNQPTVDAVEVTRCKDCEYWRGEGKYCDYDMSGLADDYCSWGRAAK